jgi:tetratricopeptide (TPR) repeat protein
MNIKETLEHINIEIHEQSIEKDHYLNNSQNKILNNYRDQLFDTYLLFPNNGIKCLESLNKLSQSGLVLLTMDKGQYDIDELDNATIPDMVTHGSMSLEVNYHALSAYCHQKGGLAKFSDYSTHHLQLGCLIFSEDAASYSEVLSSYDRFVNNCGPDVFNGMKRFSYKHIATMETNELIGLLRMSYFDSTTFIKLIPRIKQVAQRISRSDRKSLAQTFNNVWEMYFTLNEDYDLAFEIGGILYALGYYDEALEYFDRSLSLYGNTTDEYYNRLLCYYQLRSDKLFISTLKNGKIKFPDFAGWAHMDQLDLNAQ